MKNGRGHPSFFVMRAFVVMLILVLLLPICTACLPNEAKQNETKTTINESISETQSTFEKLTTLGNITVKISHVVQLAFILGLLTILLLFAVIVMAKKL